VLPLVGDDIHVIIPWREYIVRIMKDLSILTEMKFNSCLVNGIVEFTKGLRFEYGINIKEDKEKALICYRKGSLLNNFLCQFKLFQIYETEYEDFDIAQDRNTAFIYLVKSMVYFFLFFNQNYHDENKKDYFNLFPLMQKILGYFNNSDFEKYIKVLKLYPDIPVTKKFIRYIWLLVCKSKIYKSKILKLECLTKDSKDILKIITLTNMFHFGHSIHLRLNLNKALNYSYDYTEFYLSQMKDIYILSNFFQEPNFILENFGEVNHYLYIFYKMYKQIKPYRNSELFINLENYCMRNFEYNLNNKYSMFQSDPMRLHNAKQYIIQYIFNKLYNKAEIIINQILETDYVNQEISRRRSFLYLLAKVQNLQNKKESSSQNYIRSYEIYISDSEELFPLYNITKIKEKEGIPKTIINDEYISIGYVYLLERRENQQAQFYPYFIRSIRKARKIHKYLKIETGLKKIPLVNYSKNYLINEHKLTALEKIDFKLKLTVYQNLFPRFIVGYNYSIKEDIHANNIEKRYGFRIYIQNYSNNLQSVLSYKLSYLSLQMKIDILLKIAQNIQELHEKGIIHGLIKPEYILLDLDSDYIDDMFINYFYLSNSSYFERKIQKESKYIDIRYIHKELIYTRNLKKKYDKYSLGIIMYEIFSGNKAYEKMNNDQILSMDYSTFFEKHNQAFTGDAEINSKISSIIQSLLNNNKDYEMDVIISELNLITNT
jgi:hypothetical protein